MHINFHAPGHGQWHIIDHIPNPGTRCFLEYYYDSMESGWNKGADQVGLVTRLRIRDVAGFMYYQPDRHVSKEDGEELVRRAKHYWEDCRYRAAVEDWDLNVRPANIRLLEPLQYADLSSFTAGDLLTHLRRCFFATVSMVHTHHVFSCHALVPIGDIVGRLSDLSGMAPIAILNALDNCPQTPSLDNEFSPPPLSPARYYTVEKLLHSELAQIDPPTITLERLHKLGPDVSDFLNNVKSRVGFRTIHGYDIATETIAERDDIFLSSISQLFLQRNLDGRPSPANNWLLAIQENISSRQRFKFDRLITDFCSVQRLRHERGIFSDLWAIGILRHAYLEAGKRLMNSGQLPRPQLALDASLRELEGLIGGSHSPTADALQERAAYRIAHSVHDAPPTVGACEGNDEDHSICSDLVQRTEAAFSLAMSLAVDKPRRATSAGRLFSGIGASPGIAEGPARLLVGDRDPSIRRGDILVVPQATASLSVFLPQLAGVVSEFGGILSHPAILAREYHTPCVVGCSGIASAVTSGLPVAIDGSTGTVRVS